MSEAPRERPPWIVCIRHRSNQFTGSWCGRNIPGVFTFVDLNHAAYNGTEHGRLVPCPDCVRAALRPLMNGVREAAEALSHHPDGECCEQMAASRLASPSIEDFSQGFNFCGWCGLALRSLS